MLSDLLKKYVKETLEYFDRYSVGNIQISSRGVDNTPVSDAVCWTLSSNQKDSPLCKETIVKSVKEDWDVIGSEVGEKYRVVIDIQFWTPNGALVQYNDSLAITVGKDNDEEETSYSKEFKMPTSEDFEAAFEEMKKVLRQEFSKQEKKRPSCCKSSIHSCTFYPDEDFL